MEMNEKRALLEAIDILVKRPAQADENTLPIALACFEKLIDESSRGQVKVVYQFKDGD